MIELHGVRKIHNEGKANALAAVDGIDLTLQEGEAAALVGPSGSGKTTLLTLIGCLARPTEGRVFLKGENISRLPERFLAKVRRHTFGFVFQRFNLLRGLTVLENVLLPAYPTGRPLAPLKREAMALLERFDLADKAHAKTEWLSGGESQRTALARALINGPEVLIADEPTANLDSALSAAFMDLVAGLKSEGRTVILTSHDPLVFRHPIVDRAVTLHDGRLAGD